MNKVETIKDIKKNQGADSTSGEDTTTIVLGAPYGKFHVGPQLDLLDHVAMRADHLSAMLLLIHGDGMDNFERMNEDSRQGYLWLAYQLADEVKQVLPFMTVRSGAAA